MLIEIHMLQNHAPSNLNRDDTGSPKQCIFGGVKRARISSQCLKRSIRFSPLFGENLGENALAKRTRRLPDLIRKRLLKDGFEREMSDIAALKASGFGTKEGKEREKEGNTAQSMLLAPSDIEAIYRTLRKAAEESETPEKFRKVTAKSLISTAELAGFRPITVDIAMFGRMITSPAFRDVEAAAQVAHAISTNKVDQEFDYFTTVDDLVDLSDNYDSGADMIGDIEFNSSCYYKYISVDVDELVANLAGPEPSDESLKEARRLAAIAIPALLRAAVFTTPSGKQNTFAAHQLPDAILIEARGAKIPISYANAFLAPARPGARSDLMDASLASFKRHVEKLTRKFGLRSDRRLWFCTKNVMIDGVQACETLDDQIVGLVEVISQ